MAIEYGFQIARNCPLLYTIFVSAVKPSSEPHMELDLLVVSIKVVQS
jgi:hypothetical protein